MKKTIKTILLLTALCTFLACSTLKKAPSEGDEKILTQQNFESLTGTYYNGAADTTKRDKDLHWSIFDRGFNPTVPPATVHLKAQSGVRLQVTIYDGEKVVRSKTFKGKLKGGYFQFRRRYLIIPTLFTNLFRNRSFRIGLLPNGNLVTDYQQISFATFIFILPSFYKAEAYGVVFQRLE